MDLSKGPQVLELIKKEMNLTVYDTRWIPSSARFVTMGQKPNDSGDLQVFELLGQDMKNTVSLTPKKGIKCGTFGASGLRERQLATGDFAGYVHLWDLEHSRAPISEVKAHATIVNCIDGCGGQARGYGAPELATGGRDGCVRIWDTRQKDAPVAAFEPEEGEGAPRDCWAVAFGNSFNDEERCVLAGYDNGDVKLFDLRMGQVRWEFNLKNGVCGVEFDRKEIAQNKFVATCLESQFHVFDARTLHSTKGYASLTERISVGSTIWGIKHLPQNREIFCAMGGGGDAVLYKYEYPDQRSVKDANGEQIGVAGTLNMLASKNLSSQPLCGWDWSPDKEGLACCCSFDQAVRVVVVTRLNRQ